MKLKLDSKQKKYALLNPLTQRIDQYVNSPLHFNTLSGRHVLRMKIIIGLEKAACGLGQYFQYLGHRFSL